MPRAQIEFKPGQPEAIALKFAEGKRYGERALFTTTDERVFYVDEDVAQRIEREVGKAEPFVLGWTRGPKGGKNWLLEKNETSHADPPAASSRDEGTRPLPNASLTALTQTLCACFLSAIDAVSEAQAYSRRKDLGISFTAEDIRAVAISAFIQTERR